MRAIELLLAFSLCGSVLAEIPLPQYRLPGQKWRTGTHLIDYSHLGDTYDQSSYNKMRDPSADANYRSPTSSLDLIQQRALEAELGPAKAAQLMQERYVPHKTMQDEYDEREARQQQRKRRFDEERKHLYDAFLPPEERERIRIKKVLFLQKRATEKRKDKLALQESLIQEEQQMEQENQKREDAEIADLQMHDSSPEGRAKLGSLLQNKQQKRRIMNALYPKAKKSLRLVKHSLHND